MLQGAGEKITHCGYTLNLARFACMNRHRIYFAALLISGPPVYSGKYRSSGTFGSLLLNTSILFKNRIIDVRRNHLELMTDSNKMRDSCIRFCGPRARRSTLTEAAREADAAHLIPILQQDLIVLAERSTEDDARHALETVYPLLPL